MATVELALVLLPLVLLLSATADLGRAFYTYDTLVKAARGAARYLALSTTPDDVTVQAQVKNLALYGDIDGGGTPLVPGLTSTMVQICTPKLCDADHNNVPVVGSAGSTMTLVSVRIVGYTYTSVFSAVLPATFAFRPINVTM
ncbi:TadE/TadG family type IV pilus assembly protein [Azohydromonas caseinilytica]|uniref:Pilus assembly protein n=1 Tax=Azohydromonas caseinilytica TaxID=2728836 RepID=A0A848FAE6_9BURK|nr:TadE/TadG family type IV pilus assembly protein [Azohydromonas caseinilytica]NML15303.1 pilus assembly protein [Azohydromonas caseinilytica]